MKSLNRILLSFSLIIFLKYSVNSQWVIDMDPCCMFPTFISVVDTGTVWTLGSKSLYQWDTSAVLVKHPRYGWLEGLGNNLPLHNQYTCITAIDTSVAFVGDANGKIYKTTDMGMNWVQILNAGSNKLVVDIKFSKIQKNTGYIVCSPWDWAPGNFIIYKTTNFGNTWHEFSQNWGNCYYTANRSPLCVTDSAHVWCALWKISNNCTINRVAFTSNGGINWQLTDIDTGRTGIYSVTFKTDNQYGLATSYKSNNQTNIMRSTNGGVNWSILSSFSGGSGYETGLLSISESTVWFFSGSTFNNGVWHNYISKSSNEGMNWIAMSTYDSTYSFSDIDAIKFNNIIYLYSIEGDKILRHIDTSVVIGINNNGRLIPKSNSLSQNYPNPFNPVTNIGFRVADFGLVKLTVYDVLGKEIAIIVNEEMQPGSYIATWDASNYPSGVYFYKIKSGDFVESKKMVLVK